MKKLSFVLWCAFCAVVLNACDSNVVPDGSESADTGVGSAALSLQLEELPAGERYVSADGVLLDFSAFAMAFSKITLGSEELTADFTADFSDEEVVDVVALENVPPGEYGELGLTLGTASDLSGTAVLAIKSAATGGEVTSSLNGLSVLIVAEGINGGATCTIRVELTGDQTLDVAFEDADVDVTAGEEAEVLVIVDPNRIFGTVSLAPLCTGGADVLISADSNASQASALLDNFVSNEALELGSTEGHSH